MLGPLWAHLEKLGAKDPILLAIPGNHDLARPDSKKPKAALRVLLKEDSFGEISEEFWDDPDCKYREIISTAFANYQGWATKNSRSKGASVTLGGLPFASG